MRFQWRLHRLAWDLSGGRLGTRVLGMPVLELVTLGHKSGQDRSILISYVETDSGPVLAGTNAGAETDPAWIENLRANPNVRVMRSGEWQSGRARFLDGDEHAGVWSKFVEADGGYADYEAMLDRPIPIVVLELAYSG